MFRYTRILSLQARGEACRRWGTSNDDLRLMLIQNSRVLETIHRQCRPRFWLNVAANLTADAIFEAALCLGSKLCKI